MDEQLKNLGLTANDFKLLVDGLDALPERFATGEFMSDLLVTMLEDKKEPGQPRSSVISDYHHDQKKKRQREKEFIKEECKILQGKLLMLKRFMQQQGALNETIDIINKPFSNDQNKNQP